jgi:tetratricopeptide (TPR) repeat protein
VWKKVLFSVVAVSVFFALAELLLAVLGVRPVLYDEDPYVGFDGSTPLFVRDTRAGGVEVMERAANKASLFNEQEFSVEKGRDVYRIFCVGGSTVYGRPYDDRTSFCGWLRELLPVADDSREWEVINAGGISYASYRVALVMEELADYEPDLFVIYCGHNEFLERRTYSGLIEAPAAIRGIRAWLARTRTYSLLRKVLRGTPRKKALDEGRELLASEVNAILDDTIGPSAYTRDDSLRDQIVAHYRFNIARMIDMGRSAGARVLLVRPASNLRDCSPFKSEESSSTRRPRDASSTDLREIVRDALASNDVETLREVLKRLERQVENDPRHAHTQYDRGRVLLRMGRHEEAREAFLISRDEDVCPLRALTAIEEAVEEIARDRDALFVDYRASVASRSEHGIPGEKLFLDHVHPTIAGNRLLALDIVDELVRRRVVDPVSSWSEEAVDEVRRRVEAGIDRTAHAIALRNLSQVLGWAGKFEDASRLAARSLEVNPDDAEVSFHLAITLERSGDLEAAKREYENTLRIDPEHVETQYRLGRIAHKEGRLDDAVKRFRHAARRATKSAEYRASLGGALADRGDDDEAVRHLEEALRLESGNAEVRHKLAVVLLRRGDLKRAARELLRVLDVEPRDGRAHINLGLALAALEDSAGAERHFRRALEIDPSNLFAHEHLGSLLADRGQSALAIAELGTVLRIDPKHTNARAKLSEMTDRLRRSIAGSPGDVEPRYLLALALAAAGDTTAAIVEFEHVLRLEPAHTDATRTLDALRERSVERR